VGVNVTALAASIYLVIFVLDRGFDLTDEAFYILNIWLPKDNRTALTEFGYYLDLFVQVFGKDVVALRAFGLLGLLSVSGFLAYQLVQYVRVKPHVTTTLAELIIIANGIVLAALVYYRIWLITPSYNWFSLLGTILLAGGGILAVRIFRYEIKPDAGALAIIYRTIPIAAIIATGGFLGTIGRPLTGLALGVFVAIWLILTLPVKRWLMVGIAALGTFLMLAAAHIWWLEGGWAIAVERVETGMKFAEILQAGQSVSSTVERAAEVLADIPGRFTEGAVARGYLALATAAILAFGWQKWFRKSTQIEWQSVYAVAIFCGFSVFMLVWITQVKSISVGELPGFVGLDMTMFLWGILVAKLAFDRFYNNELISNIRPVTGSQDRIWEIPLLVVFFVFLALFHSLGSTTLLINGSGTAFILYASAAFLMIVKLFPQRFRLARLFLLSVAAGPGIYFFLWATDNPYRLAGKLDDQTQPITFFDSATRLKVDAPTAFWVNGIQKIAVDAGWQPGTPLIDMTGGTPGAAVVLAARAPVTPWLVGGYKGSTDFVQLALSLMQKQTLKRAWILTAPKGVRRISSEILNTAGLVFPGGYSLVDTVKTSYRNEEQFLWKPN